MSDSLHRGDTTAVSKNGVTVERRLDGREDGIIVTMELTSDVRGPIEVAVVDEFPDELPIEQVGFNVENEPDDGDISPDRVRVRHTVEDGPDRIVYAIKLSRSAADVAFDPPTIEEVTIPGVPESDAGDTDDEAEAGAETEANPAGEDGSEGLPEELALEEESQTGDADAAADRPGATADPGDSSGAANDPSSVEDAVEAAEQGGGVDLSADAGTGPAASGSAGGVEPSPPGPAGDERPSREAPSAEPQERAAAGSSEVPRSVRLRLDRLNARVEEFATYAEALEDVIERHGTAPEILETIEADVAEADERLDEVREELQDLESRHAGDVSEVRDRLDDLKDRLADARGDLEADVSAVREELEAVDADVERVDETTGEVRREVDDVRGDLEVLSAEVDALGERLEDHEADLEKLGETVADVEREVADVSRNVEAMRSEMESLQSSVDRLLRFREILADVFGGPVQRATEGGGDPFEGATDSGSAVDAGPESAEEDGPASTPTEPTD